MVYNSTLPYWGTAHTMTSLQEQSDSAFADPDAATIHEQRAMEDAQSDNGRSTYDFADDPESDAYPAPEPLEYDGKGHKKPTAEMEFADDETTKPKYLDQADESDDSAGEAQPRQTRRDSEKSDIHADTDDRDSGGDEEQDDFSSELLARAQMYGLSKEQIDKRYEKPEQLEKALLDIDQQALQQFQMWQQMQQIAAQQRYQQQPQLPPQQPMQQGAPLQQPPPAYQQTPEQQQAAFEAYKLAHPELYDEELAKDLTGLATHTQSQIHTQSQQLAQLQQLVEAQQAALQQFYQRQQAESQYNEQLLFDAEVQRLGNGWDEVLGAEDARRMDPNSPEIANRRKVYETARQLQQFHAAQGRYMALKDVLPSSLSLSFPERNAAAVTSSATGRPRDSRGRFTARPTRRQRSEQVNKREEILRKWDRAYASNVTTGGEDGI